MKRRSANRFYEHPALVGLVVLAAVLITEIVIMLLLPGMLPGGPHLILEAAIDAIVLTTVAAPLLWWLMVRPLRDANQARSRFLAELFASIEADRRQTAHNLHDGVGQSLTLLVSGLQSTQALIQNPELAARCDSLKVLAKQSLQEVKRLALGLRPSLLDDLGLQPALERLTADVTANHPIIVTLEMTDLGERRLASSVETAIFRIVQEALANVVRHSQAKNACIKLHRLHGSIEMTIADNGVGIPASVLASGSPGHIGLTGMRERATLLGGHLTVQSSLQGTTILLLLPLEGV